MKKQALLIGINDYQILPELKYARQDAEAVELALKHNYCFTDNELLLLTDDRRGLYKPTNRTIFRNHLENYANQELDLFIFGFWGHGLFRNDERYLCPLDVIANNVEEMGFSFKDLQQLISNIHAKNTCIILDCCQTVHDRGVVETFTSSEQTSIANAARDIVLKRKEQIPGFQSNVAILNSCKEGQSAYEWDDRKHGLFTAYLLDAMKKRSPSVMQIATYISNNIKKTAGELGKDQTPFYKLEGDIQLPVSSEPTPDFSVNSQTKPASRNPKDILKEIIQKEQEQIQKRLERLYNEVYEAYSNAEFARAITKCEAIQELEPTEEIKEIISRCQANQERQGNDRKLREEEERKLQAAKDMRALSAPGTEAGERKVAILNGEEFAFRWCPPGTFMMGSPESEEGRDPDEIQHQVTLSKGFWMMETQVTLKQWKAVTGVDKGWSNYNSVYNDDNLPVRNASWLECQDFCLACTNLGLTVQLPTEAQWEYACRAGTTGAFAGDLNEMAIYGFTYDSAAPYQVGVKKPNAWGLYDMHGNVCEWCQDRYGDYPSESVTDPTGALDGDKCVLRGGSYYDVARFCRSAIRCSDSLTSSGCYVSYSNTVYKYGCRCVKVP